MSAAPAHARGNPCPAEDVTTYADWRKSLTDREARMLLEQFIAERDAENDCDEWLRDYYRGV